MSFPAYPEYKDSGVEWLGEVPAHWKVKPLKRAIASMESGTSVNAADFPAAQGELGVLKTSCVYKGWFDWRENKTVNQEDLGRVSCPVRENTLIVSRMNTPELVGSAGLVAEAPVGMFLPDRLWQVSLQKRCSPKYYYYFTRSPAYREQVKISCAGTSSSMQNLGQDEFGAIWHPSPPLQEQQVIAAFLDHETARIDALVEEQQRLIELLKEKRQAVISHAVTKGLDPDVPMKDSGAEWLGEMPAHWDIFPIKRDLEFLTSGSRGWASHYSDDGAAFIRIGNLTRDHISLDLSDLQRVSVPEGSEGERTKVKEHDLLFSITAYLGSVAVVPTEFETAYVSQHIALARLFKERLLPRWVAYVTLSDVGKNYLSSQGYGGTKVQLSLEDVAQLLVTAPPLDEQAAITSSLDHETARIDALAEEGGFVIKLLQERRSALISAAVTGKIDVRGWQPPVGSAASSEATQTEMV